jgi:hypothetical protein
VPSSINFIDIDPDFPVSGQDNESQGFRDNFSLIRSALQVAQGEITDLQQKSLLKTNLSGQSLDNNMNGNSVINLKLASYVETVYGSTSSIDSNPSIEGTTVDFEFGHYHHYVVGGNITFRLSSWPLYTDASVAKIRIELVSKDAGAYNVSFNSSVTPGGSSGTIKFDQSWPEELTVDSPTDPVIVEFWSRNGGATVYAKYLGKFV